MDCIGLVGVRLRNFDGAPVGSPTRSNLMAMIAPAWLTR